LSKENSTAWFLKIFSGIFFLSVISCSAQQKTNLNVFNGLVDSSIAKAASFIPDSIKDINLEQMSGSFAIFNSEIISGFSKRGYNLVPGGNSFSLQLIIKDVVTSYGEIFRDGFLGDYYVPRKLTLSGNYNFSGKKIFTEKFNYAFQDTVKTDSISSLENPGYPFTQGKLQGEPFFSGILEPVIAVGTAALAVILFFTIRSK